MMVNDGWLRMGLIMGSIMGLYIWLVVTGTMEFWMTFHNIWEFHHPNWRSPSFFRGVGQPPSWIIYRIILPVDELIFFIRWLLHHQPERAATLCNVCKMHGLENARYLYRCSLNFIVHWFCWSNGAPADCCIFLCFFFSALVPKLSHGTHGYPFPTEISWQVQGTVADGTVLSLPMVFCGFFPRKIPSGKLT